jgi:phage major head subunit gpT-like protein
VAPGGEIEHGQLDEQSFTNKADTYGLMLSVDRRDMINDDLGAITTVPRKLGRGAGLKINDIFWTVFLNNASFFVAGNNNFQDGAATALDIDSLSDAEVLFFNQTDPDGKPLGIMPNVLLVPPGEFANAGNIFTSTEQRITDANITFPTNNPHRGKYSPVMSAYLANASYTGSSAVKWYLLANPSDLAVVETCFLNGQQSPTIESADADFNVLGIQMRGYHDFGVALQDFRGGVASKGEV